MQPLRLDPKDVLPAAQDEQSPCHAMTCDGFQVPLLLLLVAAGSAFVGWQAAAEFRCVDCFHSQAPGRSCNTTMAAEKVFRARHALSVLLKAKKKKQKQKMSLAEALDRQKKEAEVQMLY